MYIHIYIHTPEYTFTCVHTHTNSETLTIIYDALIYICLWTESIIGFLEMTISFIPCTWWQNVYVQLYFMLVTDRGNTKQIVSLEVILRTKTEIWYVLNFELFYKQRAPHGIFLSKWYLFTSALTEVNRSSATYCSISPLLLSSENVMWNKCANDCSNF